MTQPQDDIIDRLIQAALDTLHHDTDDGDAVDKYEREVLRKKFTEILESSDGRPSRGNANVGARIGRTRRPAHPKGTIPGGPIGPSGPFFLTQWEREDYERRQRGEPERGPGGSAVPQAQRQVDK